MVIQVGNKPFESSTINIKPCLITTEKSGMINGVKMKGPIAKPSPKFYLLTILN